MKRTTRVEMELVPYDNAEIKKFQAKLNKWWTDGVLRKMRHTSTPAGIYYELVLNKTGK